MDIVRVGVEMGPLEEWNVAKALMDNQTMRDYACLVLNRPICITESIVQTLWQNAKIRCTVDGGTNRWRDFLNKHCNGLQLKPPDFITGDFDSIQEETWKFFNNCSIQKVHTPDQNATDFTKAVRVVQPLMQDYTDIVVLHETSGRFDHIMANMNTLYQCQSSSLNLYLLASNSITWLLRAGKHSITIPKQLVEQQRWCALIPIGERAHGITTRGLKWDLTNDVLEFGGMVSTSNTYANERVEIINKTNLVWSMGLFASDND